MGRPRLAPESVHDDEFKVRTTKSDGLRLRQTARKIDVPPAVLLRMAWKAIEENDIKTLTFLIDSVVDDDCF